MKSIFIRSLNFMVIMILVTTISVSANDELEQIQKAIKDKGASWVAGENVMTKLSKTERQIRYGALPEPTKNAAQKLVSLPTIEALPDSFDWRDNNGDWVTPVRSQGNCGSCWDFSAVAQIEAWWKINNNSTQDINLSEQFILSCSDGGCDGWQVSSALDFVVENGIPLESCFPYYEDDTIPCENVCANWEENAVNIPGWGYITLDEAIVENIKQAVYRHPVSASYRVYEDFDYYTSGIYEHVWGEEVAGHAILIVGWNDAEQSWTCKNSWGSYWGESGYFRIKWGECSIGTNMPFIWDSLASADALTTDPETVEMTLGTSDTTTYQVITLLNNGPDVLEYAAIDYEIPVRFHQSDFMSYSGSKSWWCSDVNIPGYKDHWLQYLDTPILDLSTTTSPVLNFQAYWTVEGTDGASSPYDGWDGWNVWVSADGGKNFTVATPVTPAYTAQSLWSFGDSEQGWDFGSGIAGWAGIVDNWQAAEFDLTSYISDSVIVRFAFASDLAYSSIDDGSLLGVFVDDILISDDGNTIFSDGAEDTTQMITTGFGLEDADWLSLTNSVGTIPAYTSTEIGCTFNNEGLESGNYAGKISISTNSVSTYEVGITLVVEETVSVYKEEPELVKDWQLYQNYPNPFNPQTTISFYLSQPEHISLSIYTVTGQLVRTLESKNYSIGTHTINWDGKNEAGLLVSSGKYFYVLKSASNETLARQMVLIK